MSYFSWLSLLKALVHQFNRISEQDADGNTPLHVAFLELGNGFVVDLLMGKYLLETAKNLTNGDGLSFLHIVCTRPYVEVVGKVLLDEEVNVDCKVNQRSTSIYAGYTPLHFAVKFNQREVAELLITRYNANLYEQDTRGSTPLHLALECGNLEMLDLLLACDRRRDNIVNDRGLSHFMASCAGSDELIVEEYLRAAPASQFINATVNHVAGYRFAGYTPLHFAVEIERANTAQLLKDRGAEETTPSNLSGNPGGDAPSSGLGSPGYDAPSSGLESRESSMARGKRNIRASIHCFVFGIIASALFLCGVFAVNLHTCF